MPVSKIYWLKKRKILTRFETPFLSDEDLLLKLFLWFDIRKTFKNTHEYSASAEEIPER